MYEIPDDPVPNEGTFTPDPPPEKKAEKIDWNKIAITLFLICGMVLTLMGSRTSHTRSVIGLPTSPEGLQPPIPDSLATTLRQNLSTLRNDWDKLISSTDTVNQWDPSSAPATTNEQIDSAPASE